ncbi:TetR/AcrR family transcriptional regulator [Lentzea flaviverrucosa]|uniref:Transcriptional regulator, TetR family n=1 Tax=Lentzea flaviverrucosa TaxID=200379 RepID=A0A1H9HN29_9PSEU|nr:TetR family transcriptional regulator [Lentzea flaviverrucosa]RDI34536.1 TetR family transcriptional regulator [Lentzea flaviverrucosa]SEQ63642.1 transcriptional regulator, TetR family [Lentzea flaviverrucosa]
MARLSKQDWLTAALTALAEGGVSAVAVVPLAQRLGVTRGSFYWHFTDRTELLRDALLWWEQQGTIAVIDQVAPIADPRDKLRRLFLIAITEDPASGLEPALVAHADDPVVAPILQRVTERRVAFLTEAYAELGLSAARARQQAVVAYSAYVGWMQLRRATPGALPEVVDDPEALAYLVDTLTRTSEAGTADGVR